MNNASICFPLIYDIKIIALHYSNNNTGRKCDINVTLQKQTPN